MLNIFTHACIHYWLANTREVYIGQTHKHVCVTPPSAPYKKARLFLIRQPVTSGVSAHARRVIYILHGKGMFWRTEFLVMNDLSSLIFCRAPRMQTSSLVWQCFLFKNTSIIFIELKNKIPKKISHCLFSKPRHELWAILKPRIHRASSSSDLCQPLVNVPWLPMHEIHQWVPGKIAQWSTIVNYSPYRTCS